MKQPKFQRLLKDTDSDFLGDTPANLAAFTKAEAEKWGEVAKATGATVDQRGICASARDVFTNDSRPAHDASAGCRPSRAGRVE